MTHFQAMIASRLSKANVTAQLNKAHVGLSTVKTPTDGGSMQTETPCDSETNPRANTIYPPVFVESTGPVNATLWRQAAA